jgi:hypothetical protein
MSAVTNRGSEVITCGVKGTYRTKLGGVGLAYRVRKAVVSSGGNGFYYPVENLETFTPDGGAGYLAAVRGLALPPAYKR